jgi:hypothetical protein
MTEKKWGTLPDAKRHEVLRTISQELTDCHTARECVIYGHKYALKTLDPFEEIWADGCIDGDNVYQFARNRRAPYLAAAITAIDDIPVEKLFVATEEFEEKMLEKAWRRREMLRWLIEGKHGDFIQKLWAEYLIIEEKRTHALENLDPLSKTTPNGESLATFSPEKEVSA